VSLIIGLLAAALVLVFFEVVLPGGILGILAALCIIAATWAAGVEYGAGGAVLTFAIAAVAVAVLVVIEFKFVAKSSLGKAFFLKSSVTGHSNKARAEASIVGQEGEALTRLNPSGKVAIGGQSYEAHSADGFIEVGTPIRVTGQDNFKLIIQKL
jgi:membrane-bound serine protease (ClpP class)